MVMIWAHGSQFCREINREIYHSFKHIPGKWYPMITAYLVNRSWGLENNYLTRLEMGVFVNGREHGYSEEQLHVLESYIPPNPNLGK